MFFGYNISSHSFHVLTFVLCLQMLAAKFSGNFIINLLGVWGVSMIFMHNLF